MQIRESESERTLSVSLSDLNRLKALKGLSPLSCYTFNEKRKDWDVQEFPRDKNNIFLSSTASQDPSSDELRDGNFITLTLLSNFWFLFNRHNGKQCVFNRLHQRHEILVANSASLVEIGECRLLVTNRRTSSWAPTYQSPEQQQTLSGMPGPGEYGIKSPQGLFHYPIMKNVLVGSHPICDIPIKGCTFSALFLIHKARPYLLCLGDDRITVNQQDPGKSLVPLADGDEIRIGFYSLTLVYPKEIVDSSDQEIPENGLCLVSLNADDHQIDRCYLPSVDYPLVFGKDESCDCVLNRDGLSRRHAKIMVYDGYVEVEDCGSTNGTFINNQRIVREKATPGNVISLGPVNFLLAWYHG